MQSLEKMRLEFPEVWNLMIKNAMQSCFLALEYKMKRISEFDKNRRREERIELGLETESESEESDMDDEEDFMSESYDS